MTDTDFEVRLRARLADAAELAPPVDSVRSDAPPLPVARSGVRAGRRPGQMMIAVAAVVVTLAVVVGLTWLIVRPGGSGVSDPDGGSAASCAGVIVFDDVEYIPVFPARTPVPGPVVGDGVMPPCLDTHPAPSPTEQGTPVTVHQVPGVDPSIAVMANGWVMILHDAYPELPVELAHLNEPVTCTEPGQATGDVHEVTKPNTTAQGPTGLLLEATDGAILGDRWSRLVLVIALPDELAAQFDDPLTAPSRVLVTYRCEGDMFLAETVERV